MSTTAVQTLAFILLLATLPLTSLGTTNDQPVLWWLGLGALVVGGLLPPATRFGLGSGDDEEEEGATPEPPETTRNETGTSDEPS